MSFAIRFAWRTDATWLAVWLSGCYLSRACRELHFECCCQNSLTTRVGHVQKLRAACHTSGNKAQLHNLQYSSCCCCCCRVSLRGSHGPCHSRLSHFMCSGLRVRLAAVNNFCPKVVETFNKTNINHNKHLARQQQQQSTHTHTRTH